METLTLEINNPATIQAIASAAAQKGVTADAYALDLLETALQTVGASNGGVTGDPPLQAFFKVMAADSENAPVLPPEANERAFYYEEQD